MVSLYFGLPGSGKTTMLASIALDAVKKHKYKNVYSNVGLNIPGVTVIDNDCIGQYELADCLLLIDEATLFADSRDFKNFNKDRLAFFLEHRHRHADICLFTQQWDGVDRKIRTITDRVYYIYKGIFTRQWISKCYRIPYGIIIPDPKSGSDKLGEIVQGYSKPPIFVRLFAKQLLRAKYYRYFDSWELDPLPALPSRYRPVSVPFTIRRWFKQTRLLSKAAIMLQKRKSCKSTFSLFSLVKNRQGSDDDPCLDSVQVAVL